MQNFCKIIKFIKGKIMLLEFSAKNYRSFKDEFTFCMEPDNAKKEWSYSILKEIIADKEYHGLCSSVIYGPNAAGKSNIIEAMDTFKSIIGNGHIKNTLPKLKMENLPNVAACQLNLIPNYKLKKAEPVAFRIKFTAEEFLFEYVLEADFGKFSDRLCPHKVINEKLCVNNDLIFSRTTALELAKLNVLKRYKDYVETEDIESGLNFANKSLKEDELFLTNGFKNILSPSFADMVTGWIKTKLFILYHSDAYHSSVNMNAEAPYNAMLFPERLQKFINEIGLNSNKICFMKNNEKADPILCSIINKDKGQYPVIPSEFIESYGTVRLVHLLFPLIYCLSKGAVLIADEFDSSLHPMVVMSIIDLFHNAEVNTNNAQLIFNTHNPIFLNNELFRRDEIKFVDRDEEQYSELYSLSDFPTSGKSSVRNTTDYMTNYFVNRYGAIRDVDFTEFFKEILKDPKSNLEIAEDVR